MGTDGAGWRCWRCDNRGNALDLVKWKTFGSTSCAGRWPELRERCASLGLMEPGKAPKTLSLATRPPAHEVAEIWEACRHVTTDQSVSFWLDHRDISPETVGSLDLMRALPQHQRLPSWMFRGRSSWAKCEQEYRCVVPLYDERGQLASLHARALYPLASNDKAASPKGHALAGLVMANGRGRNLLLNGSMRFDSWRSFDIGIAEGVPDFLTLATETAEAPVFGIISGSWTPAIAARIPDGARVLVATDPDEAGEEYAAEIASSLESRCGLLRWRASGDLTEVGFQKGRVEAWS